MPQCCPFLTNTLAHTRPGKSDQHKGEYEIHVEDCGYAKELEPYPAHKKILNIEIEKMKYKNTNSRNVKNTKIGNTKIRKNTKHIVYIFLHTKMQIYKSQVEGWGCVRSRMGAKPSPHPCPCQTWGGLQQMWMEGDHIDLIDCKVYIFFSRWWFTDRLELVPINKKPTIKRWTMLRRVTVSSKSQIPSRHKWDSIPKIVPIIKLSQIIHQDLYVVYEVYPAQGALAIIGAS